MGKSRIILALDHLTERLLQQLFEISHHIAAIKVGWPLILRAGLSFIEELKNWDIPVIADLKLADIPHTMVLIAENLQFVDAIIAHAFVGEGAIREFKEHLSKMGISLFLVTAMSHPSAEDFINKHFKEFLRIAKKYADGVIVPATFPGYIEEARSSLGKSKIIAAPGIGAQGAKVGSAIRRGADYEIIGRLITLSDDPRRVIDEINRKHMEILGAYP